MFLRLSTTENIEHFSYMLCKNPANVFYREMDKNRQIFGKFPDGDQCYEVTVISNPLGFLETARQLNMSNYLHTQIGGVCPYLLCGFDEVFKSILSGKKPKELMDEQFNIKSVWKLMMGPYPCKSEIVETVFKHVGITVVKMDDEIAKTSFMFDMVNDEPCTLTEFLQKVFIVSTYLTHNKTLAFNTSDKIEKFVKLCASWLETTSIRNSLVNRLCNNKKSHIELFENKMFDKIETGEVVVENRSAVDERHANFKEHLKKVGLHQKRHNIIIENIKSFGDGISSIVELGCGGGQLIRTLVEDNKNHNYKYVGFEANSLEVEKAQKRFRTGKVKIKKAS